MGLSPRYSEYLAHFGSTVPLCELATTEGPVVALRHDVDHDLDLALDMAFREREADCRATYFLLHTASYWEDPSFETKCRQLLDYGHEIGLHVDVFSERSRDPELELGARIDELLAALRASGASVTGVAAHGAPECYRYGYVNNWMWSELRGSNPETTQQGLSAEGIPSNDERFSIDYPDGDTLRWADGSETPLWQLSMADHGLDYEAVRLPTEHYWTDSGGNWRRSGDPLGADLTTGRHQVLVHPYWWRGPEAKIFVLSPARSGSKWLSQQLEHATSLNSRHEFTLNHVERDDEVVADKHTDNFQDLLEQRSEALGLLREGLRLQRKAGGDRAEANVYLPFFLDEFSSMEPGAKILHLHRDARESVRSLLERGWYETPEDRKHPHLEVEGWESMSQLERCCWYLRWVHEEIAPWATARISFERMVAEKDYLREVFAQIGVIVHPRLLDESFPQRLNATKTWSVPSFEDWSSEQRENFDTICGVFQEALGYGRDGGSMEPAREKVAEAPVEESRRTLEDLDLRTLGGRGIGVFAGARQLEFRVVEALPTCHVLLAKGAWGRLPLEDGLSVLDGCYYVCRFEGDVEPGRAVRIFALFFDEAGAQVRRLQVGTWRSGTTELEVSFSSAVGSTHFAVGLHYGEQEVGAVHSLRHFEVCARRFPSGYRFEGAAPEAGADS